jgi:putative oxidoreductase
MGKNEDLAKLLLRVMVGGLLIFHGFSKIIHGVGVVKAIFLAQGIPTFFAYFAYVGEVIAPLLIILGVYARWSALVVAGTIAVALFTTQIGAFFSVNQFGGWALELQAFYILGALSIFFLGSGSYAFKKD